MNLPATPLEVAHNLGARLSAAAVAHRDAQEVASKRAKTFRQLVVEALDAGMRQADVAQLAGVSRSRLHAILAREYARA